MYLSVDLAITLVEIYPIDIPVHAFKDEKKVYFFFFLLTVVKI